jgi:plasmid stabilization system protein ParE
VIVDWRPRALSDIDAIFQHIAEENPIAARRVVREILLAGDSLVLFPKRGRDGRISGTRELLAVRPYQIVYVIRNDVVTIVRVWHSAQDG